MSKFFLIIPLLCLTAIGHSQQVYRCGSTFSQQPCGPDARVSGKPAPAAAPSPEVMAAKLREPVADSMPPETLVTANKAMCEQKTRASLKDPESARITAVTRTGAANHYHSASRQIVVGSGYTLLVNAKNSYGGYTGEKMWACVFNLDESKLLLVYQLER